MVPLFALPGWMQTAGTLSPVKWGILALEGALWRGFGWAELALPCGILLAVGAVGFGLGVRRFDRSA
jgi:ABC-2 type transport system permease protein